MRKEEIAKLFNRIKNHYNTFTTSDDKIDEWYKFLKDYSNEDVNRRFDEYLSYGYEQAPLCMSLTKNIEKQNIGKTSWVTECDICKQRITIYDNDMEEYEKHFRKCSMIDFINLMSKKYRNEEICKSKYYQMSDEELQKNYDKIMKFYREHRDSTPSILKGIPEGD